MGTRVFSSAELAQQVAGMQATLGNMMHILKVCQRLETEYRAQGRYESELATAVKARYAEVQDLAAQVVAELGGSNAAMASDFYDALDTFQLIIKPGRPIDWETADLTASTKVLSGSGTKPVFAGLAVSDIVEITGLADSSYEGMDTVAAVGGSNETITLSDTYVDDLDSADIQVKLIEDNAV